MNRRPAVAFVYLALLVFFGLHNDLWLWDDPDLVLGLPVGLTYHLGYCLVASVLMALLVWTAGPSRLSSDSAPEGQR